MTGLLALVGPAASAGAHGPAPPASAAREEPRQRELVVMAEDSTLEAWDELVALSRAFEQRHPGTRVRLLSLGGAAGTQDRVKFMLAGDLPLDLTRIDVTEMPAFVSEGALIDLAPFAARDPGFDPGDYFEIALEPLRATGGLLGLPQTFTPYVMYVNMDLLRAQGLARPADDWSWQAFLELARRTTRDTDGDGKTDEFGVSLTQWLQAVSPWIWQQGGALLSADRTRSELASPDSVEALRFLRALLHEERVASFDATFAGQLRRGLFQDGRAAFYGPVGYWEMTRLKSVTEFDWDVLPLPRSRVPATAVAMGIFVVPRTAREPELAWAFLREVLCGREYQRAMALTGNGIPGLRSVAREVIFDAPSPAEHVAVFEQVLEHARFMPPLANWRKIADLCQAELDGLLYTGEVSPEAAGRRMAAKTDAYLAREAERAGRPRLPARVLEWTLGLSILTLLAAFCARRGRAPALPRRAEERQAYGMIALWAAGFLLFLFGPAMVSLLLSLCEWSPLRGTDEVAWLGGQNYARLASDPSFHASLLATSTYVALAVPFGLVVALALALALRSESRLVSAVRTACYLPAILSPVLVATVWLYLLDGERGLVNELLGWVGIDGPDWLRRSDLVVPSLALMALWSVGAQMLVFLAALKALDPCLEEAARIDGAGPLRRLWHVTLPALSPVILFNGITGAIAAFQVFAQPYIMTQGGPGDASRFLVLYLYESGFRHLDMGYASAIAWVLFAILAVFAWALLRGSRRWVHYAGRSLG